MSASSDPRLRFSKGEPAIVGKIAKGRKVVNLDRKAKDAVRFRDKEACRVCLRWTRDVHERLFKSLGGIASLHNSMVACRRCHVLLQGHAIQPFGRSCNKRLTFEMTQGVAHDVFRGRSTPSHVVIVG